VTFVVTLTVPIAPSGEVLMYASVTPARGQDDRPDGASNSPRRQARFWATTASPRVTGNLSTLAIRLPPSLSWLLTTLLMTPARGDVLSRGRGVALLLCYRAYVTLVVRAGAH